MQGFQLFYSIILLRRNYTYLPHDGGEALLLENFVIISPSINNVNVGTMMYRGAHTFVGGIKIFKPTLYIVNAVCHMTTIIIIQYGRNISIKLRSWLARDKRFEYIVNLI